MDGKWNSLRAKGNTRPLSILQICSDARQKYANMKQEKMVGMISPLSKQICFITLSIT